MKKILLYLAIAIFTLGIFGCSSTETKEEPTISAEDVNVAEMVIVEPVWMPDGLMPDASNAKLEFGNEAEYEVTLSRIGAWAGTAWINDGNWESVVPIGTEVTGITFEAKADYAGNYKFTYELGDNISGEESLSLTKEYKQYTVDYPEIITKAKIPLMMFLDGNSAGMEISVKNVNFVTVEPMDDILAAAEAKAAEKAAAEKKAKADAKAALADAPVPEDVLDVEPIWMADGLMPDEKNGSIELGEEPEYEVTLELIKSWTGVAWINDGNWEAIVPLGTEVTGIAFEAKAEAAGAYKFVYELGESQDEKGEESIPVGTEYKKYSIMYPKAVTAAKIPLMVFLDGKSAGKTISVKNVQFITPETEKELAGDIGGMLKNGAFNEDINLTNADIPQTENIENWHLSVRFGGDAEYDITDGVLGVDNKTTDAEAYGVQLIQQHLNIEHLGLYQLTFSAKAEEARSMQIVVGAGAAGGWKRYYEETIDLTTEMKKYTIEFKMNEKTDPNTRLEFWLTSSTAKVWMDNVSMVKTGVGKPNGIDTIFPGTNAIKNGNFITGDSKWTAYVDDAADAEFIFEKAEAKVAIKDEGPENWSVQLVQGTFGLEKSKQYIVSFDAMSTVPRVIELIIQNKDGNIKHLAGKIPLTTEMQTYGAMFEMENDTDGEAQLVIAMGNMGDEIGKVGQDHEVVLDNVNLEREVGSLVWSDEFDYEGLPDPEAWNFEVGGGGWGNAEYQFYTDKRLENAEVSNGTLKITARKENYGGNEYTSARLTTQKKQDFLYGRMEFRAKLPGGVGTWPALWMMPTYSAYGIWPASGEIDVMEYVGYDKGVVHGNTHCMKYNFMLGNNKGDKLTVKTAEDEFHIYALEWLPDRLDFYVDNKLYYSIENEHKGWEYWPFDQEFFFVMNLAVGGNWGAATGFDETIWPRTLEVDYVRVYDLNIDLTDDDEDPTAPGAVSAEPSSLMLPLAWDASTDNIAVERYELYMDGELLLETKQTKHLLMGLEPETEYEFKIRAFDYAGNASDFTTSTIKTAKLMPKKLPAKIKAADYDIMAGVQTEDTQDSDGGKNVGWIDNGDSLTYIVEVAKSGTYTVDLRVASLPGGGVLQFQTEDGEVLSSTDLPETGDWQAWETVTGEVELEAGVYPLVLYAETGGFNLNWFDIK